MKKIVYILLILLILTLASCFPEHEHVFGEGVYIVCPTDEIEGRIEFECLICHQSKAEFIPVIQGKLVASYPELSNADIVYYEGFIYTYGGNADGISGGRTNSIYRYDIENDKLYELNVKLGMPSTSHRVVLVGSKVYIFGGLGNKVDGVTSRNYNVLVHDLEAQTIEKLTNENGEEVVLPFGVNCHQVGLYNNVIYFDSRTG